MSTEPTQSKGMLWTGRVISILVILFLLVDAIMKVMEAAVSMEGSTQLGWPAELVQNIGIILLIATILYAIPKTSVLGAIFITGYLGGAVSIMMRIGQPFYFPIIFGILVWAGLFLQDAKLRVLLPVKK